MDVTISFVEVQRLWYLCNRIALGLKEYHSQNRGERMFPSLFLSLVFSKRFSENLLFDTDRDAIVTVVSDREELKMNWCETYRAGCGLKGEEEMRSGQKYKGANLSFKAKPTAGAHGQRALCSCHWTNVNAWSLLNSIGTLIGTGGMVRWHENRALWQHAPVVGLALK